MAVTTLPINGLGTPSDSASDGPRHIMGMEDLAGEIGALIRTSSELKARSARGALPGLLGGKAVVVVFEKNSTRTRVSFDLGIQRLGGASTILEAQTSQLGRGESIEDTATVLSRYGDAIVYRANSHTALTEMAGHATVPVVNALTDLEHPCQVLADLATLAEHRRANGLGLVTSDDAADRATLPELTGATLAYVGDGNNMCNSYLLGAPLVGMDVQIATPQGYEPDAAIVQRAHELAADAGTSVHVGHHPTEAVDGADAIATDTWISMGDEAEAEQRLADFDGFTVDDELMGHANADAVFMHCLPGHWGHEATYEVAHGPRSLILDEAENRMWTQMALLDAIINGPKPGQVRLATQSLH